MPSPPACSPLLLLRDRSSEQRRPCRCRRAACNAALAGSLRVSASCLRGRLPEYAHSVSQHSLDDRRTRRRRVETARRSRHHRFSQPDHAHHSRICGRLFGAREGLSAQRRLHRRQPPFVHRPSARQRRAPPLAVSHDRRIGRFALPIEAQPVRWHGRRPRRRMFISARSHRSARRA